MGSGVCYSSHLIGFLCTLGLLVCFELINYLIKICKQLVGFGYETPPHQRFVPCCWPAESWWALLSGLPLPNACLLSWSMWRWEVVGLSVSLPNWGMSSYDCLWQNMTCGLKKLNWRNVRTMSSKEVGTTSADFITIMNGLQRSKSKLPCPKTWSRGAQFFLEVQSVVLYTHETSERSTSTAC